MAIVPTSITQAQALLDAGYTYLPGRGLQLNLGFPGPSTAPPSINAEAVGLKPEELAATLYDKPIPVWVGGVSLIGGRIIEGPLFRQIDGEWTASWISAFCVPANFANATRTVRSLRLQGKEVWNTTDGALLSGLNVGIPTSTTGEFVRFNTGTLTQLPDAWSVSNRGALAIAYRPMVTAAFENIRTARFGNVVPFASVELADTQFGDPDDGVTWQEVVELLAQYDDRSAADFEASNLSGRVIALILGAPVTFPDVLTGFRAYKPQWSILTEDKLRLVEKGAFAADLQVDTSRLVAKDAEPFISDRGDARQLPREQLLTFIDYDRDYEPSTVRVSEDIDPVQATDAFESQAISAPVVSTATEMLAENSFSFYSKELARETGQYSALRPYMGITPGDTQQIAAGYKTYTHRATEVVRNPDDTVDVKTEGFLTCAIASSDYVAGAVRFAVESAMRQLNSALSNTRKITMSFWAVEPIQSVKFLQIRDEFFAAQSLVDSKTSTADTLGWRFDQLLAAATFASTQASAAAVGVWHHYFISVDTDHASGSKVAKVWLDGAEWAYDTPVDSSPAFDIALNNCNMGVPGVDLNQEIEIDMADVQIWFGTFIDPSLADNITKFIAAGRPVDPAVAAAAFGTQSVLFKGGAADFPVNQGSGGAWTLSGSISDAPTSPSD